jgi:EPTP domain
MPRRIAQGARPLPHIPFLLGPLLFAQAATASSIALREVASLATAGCAGFEHTVVRGANLLVAANFWDGVAPDMGADSVVYRIDSSGRDLALKELQRIRGRGAHGADSFAVGAERFLAIPSYYGCGSDRGPAKDSCKSTQVLRFDASRALEGGAGRGAGARRRRLATSGPAQTVSFAARDGTPFVVVGENFNDHVVLYRGSAAAGEPFALSKHQSLRVPGAGSMAVAEAGDELLLVAASYHDNGWSTRSRVFRADARSPAADLRFAESQTIDTNGCHDVELQRVGGELFLFLSEDRSPTGTRIESSLLAWDASTSKFVVHQRIPTDGAHGAKLFEGPDGNAYLFVANFGDRLGGRYASRSALWRQPARGRHQQFEFVADVPSQGATDAEHFVFAGRHFLAVANEGDIGARLHQRSAIYEVEVEGVRAGGEL